MTRIAFVIAAVLAASLSMSAQADDVTAGGLKISAPWARATPKGASVGAGYMKISNTGNEPDRLVGGGSDASSSFEIHEMRMDNGVMKMRELINGIEIKPGQTVAFSPGGHHLMFVGLKNALVKGQHVKATLQFEKAGKIDVDFVIEAIGAQSGGDHAMPGMKMQH
jgi:periplasmic copper chaperone A